MRFAVFAVTLALGGSAAASAFALSVGVASRFADFAASLPDPATAALMFGGLGLVAGARRMRSNAVAD